jgi:CheY-like chemotaxis protein/two-component sensor histidine kinase
MSHDIRTPLNGIIGMTYLASEQDNPPKTKDCLKKVDTSSKYLLSLVNDILDMSKAESNKIEFHPEPYSFEEFNIYIDSLIRPLAEQKDQKFILNEDRIPSSSVPLIDKLRMNQIAFNLLSNAVKYTPEGGKINFTIFGEETAEKKMKVTYVVSDNGIGMSDNFQAHLFQPFTQENRTYQSEAHGSGLGLAIVKKLVEGMKGSINVCSKINEGTSFTLQFDFDTVEKSSCQSKRQSEKNENAGTNSLAGKHILLCEDNVLNQEIAKAIISEKGAIVETEDNGLLGLEAFKKSPENYYACVLLDIHMPIMDGYEAAVRLRSLKRADAKTVPLIAMTADAFEEDVKKCLSAGMDGHIAKPIDPKQLYSTLLKYIK